MPTATITRTIRAPRETVFDVLTDHAGYSKITPLRKTSLEREGTTDRNGVGAIRRFEAVGPAIREEVTEYERPSRFGYKLLSGAPMKSHVVGVDLEDDGSGGTRMTTRLDTQPKIPFAFPVIKAAVGQLGASIQKEAERRAGAG